MHTGDLSSLGPKTEMKKKEELVVAGLGKICGPMDRNKAHLSAWSINPILAGETHRCSPLPLTYWVYGIWYRLWGITNELLGATPTSWHCPNSTVNILLDFTKYFSEWAMFLAITPRAFEGRTRRLNATNYSPLPLTTLPIFPWIAL